MTKELFPVFISLVNPLSVQDDEMCCTFHIYKFATPIYSFSKRSPVHLKLTNYRIIIIIGRIALFEPQPSVENSAISVLK
jgi:hypothetical protein